MSAVPNVAALPEPLADQIRRTLEVLFRDGDVIELRAIHKGGRKRVDSGFFDSEHREKLIEEAVRLNRAGAAVYVTLNPLDPQLLARCANRIQEYAQATATDANVIRRRWLLIDIDPQRPKDTSATAEQLALVLKKATEVYDFLAGLGFAKPVSADSGNGLHFKHAIDLPNDDESRDLIKRVLEALAARFDDDAVKIDRSVFNAARIVKLHGTVANKGDHVAMAPWRLSKLRTVPTSLEVVPVDKLRELAAEVTPAPQPTAAQTGLIASAYRSWTEVDVAAFLARGGIEAIGPEPHDGALRWKLKACPFNPDHGPGESAVFLRPDGRLGFNCKHSSCADKHWRDLREKIDGPRESRSELGASSQPQRPRGSAHDTETEVSVVTLSSVPKKALRPLWPGKLWRGKLSMMAGDPGLGKSLSTLDIAARITTGSAWPASVDKAPLGDVVILSAEDDAADTLRPRLEACGADLDRVHVVLEVTEHDRKTGAKRRKSFRLGAHIDQLERIFQQHKPLLLIIDPITAYMSADTDSHATADVRADLAPLADLAQRYGVAVLMVSHLNKATTMQALYRVTGSVAFVAAARSAFGVVKDPNDKDRRYVLPLKSNLGKDTGGLAYRITSGEGMAPRIEWEPEPVDVDIDELTTAAITPRERAKQSAESAIAVWLRDQLSRGPVAAADIWRRAEEAEHPERKVRAAIKTLGIVMAPAGYGGAWHYALPPESDTHAGSQNVSNSVRVWKISEENTESDNKRVSDSGNFRGNTHVNSTDTPFSSGDIQSRASPHVSDSANSCRNIQSRTESDGFWEPGKLPDSGEPEAF